MKSLYEDYEKEYFENMEKITNSRGVDALMAALNAFSYADMLCGLYHHRGDVDNLKLWQERRSVVNRIVLSIESHEKRLGV